MKVIKIIFVALGYLLAGYVLMLILATWLQSANPSWGESDGTLFYTSNQAFILGLVMTVCLLVGFHFARKKFWKHN